MGIITAMIVMRYNNLLSNVFLFILSNILFLVIALAATALHEKFGRMVDVTFIALMGLAAATIIVQAKAAYLESFFSKQKGLLLLGNASYSIYLIHFPVLSAMGKMLQMTIDNTLHPLINFSFMVIVATIIGVFVHLWIEKPLITYLSQQAKLKRKRAANNEYTPQ